MYMYMYMYMYIDRIFLFVRMYGFKVFLPKMTIPSMPLVS